MILNETVAAIADAIREKTGKSELIKPVDFASEIKGISVGGGESGGNTYEYIELTRPEGWEGEDFYGEVVTPLIMLCALLVKVEINGGIGIGTAFVVAQPQAMPIAIAYDPNILVYLGEMGYKKVSEVFQMYGLPELPRLTKEQFYDLNA